jgi:hypothetical protein
VLRIAKALSCALLAFGFLTASAAPSGLSVPAAAAKSEESTENCVGFTKSEEDKGLSFAVRNACDMKLACKMRWTLTCETNEGKVTATKSASTKFAVDASADGNVFTSAETCKQAWRIDNVSWSCDPAK